MNLRARIIHDINSISDQRVLRHLFNYVQVIKWASYHSTSNQEAVLRFAETLTDAEATELRYTLNQEFGQLEGEW